MARTNLLGGVQGPALRSSELSGVMGVKNQASLCINLED